MFITTLKSFADEHLFACMLFGLFGASFLAGFLLEPFRIIAKYFKFLLKPNTANKPLAVMNTPVVTVAMPILADQQTTEANKPIFECATIHTVKVQGGHRLVFYVYLNTIRRSFWFHTFSKEEINGEKKKRSVSQKRHTLTDLNPSLVTLAEAIKQSRTEVEQRFLKKSDLRTKRTTRVHVTPAMVMPAMPIATKVTANPNVEVSAPAGVSTDMLAPAKVIEITTTEPVSKELPLRNKLQETNLSNLPMAKAVREATGTIIEAGLKKRDGSGEKKPFTAFRVLIHTDSGIQKELWGVDLQRAIEDSGAKLGDRVNIRDLGRQAVTVPDKEHPGKMIDTFKNLFSISFA